MLVDLHNHTPLCNHAKGEISAYIEAAITAKTRYFGFSDHAPMDFDEAYRMKFEQMPLYEKEILQAKADYHDRIHILLGYEVDFLPGHMDTRVLTSKVDYLIGSVHFLDGWGFDNPAFIETYQHKDIDTLYRDYFAQIKALADSHLFDIVGHLDLIKVFDFRPKTDVRLLAKEAIAAIKKADMTIELSVAGYRKPCKEAYPSDALLQLIADADIPITFASDAHHPKQVGFKSEEIEAKARAFGYSKCATFLDRERILINF
jgi:histidinol-phosphatase (PHP family)